jgi:hypothetical protein
MIYRRLTGTIVGVTAIWWNVNIIVMPFHEPPRHTRTRQQAELSGAVAFLLTEPGVFSVACPNNHEQPSPINCPIQR